MKSFFQGRIRGVRFAARGAFLLFKNEASIQVQSGIAIVVTITGFYFDLSVNEWMMQIFSIGLVMSLEGINTAAEEIANFVHPDYHTKIGYIKDVAAGAVFFAAVTAIIIGFIIYVPKF